MEGIILASIALGLGIFGLFLYLAVCASIKSRENRCKHEWEIREKHLEPTALQKAKDGGFEASKSLSMGWVERTLILVIVCKKCGELRIEEFDSL